MTPASATDPEPIVRGDRASWAAGLVPSDLDHIATRIAGAEMRTEPFAHLLIDEALPSDLYQAMDRDLDRLPADQQRASVLITDYEVPARHLTAAAGRLRAALTSDRLIQAALDRFAPVLRPLLDDGRHPGGWATITPDRLRPKIELMRDGGFLMLPPHTDDQARLFGGLIYFARPGDPEELGTRFYRPLDPEMRCLGHGSHPFELFEEAGGAPFGANTLCLFARTDRSFHGFTMRPAGVDRRAVQWSCQRDRRG